MQRNRIRGLGRDEAGGAWVRRVLGLGAMWIGLAAMAMRVEGAFPDITAMSPLSGGPGTQLTLYGRNFGSISRVVIGNAEAPILAQNTVAIAVVVPNAATSGPVYVYDGSNFDYTDNSFLVAPRITGISPGGGKPGDRITIRGANLSNMEYAGEVAVYFNGLKARQVYVAADTIVEAVAPTGLTTGPVTVQTLAGFDTTKVNFFSLPIIQGFQTNLVTAGDRVNVYGWSLNGITSVRMGALEIPFQEVNATNLLITVPTNAADGLVIAGNPVYSSLGAPLWIRPKVDAITPSNAAPGKVVSLWGSGLYNVRSVTIGGKQVTVGTNFPPNRFDAVVPANPDTGPVVLATQNGTNTSVALYYAAPAIADFSPAKGRKGAQVTVTGKNLTGASEVRLGGVASEMVSASAGTLIFKVPPDGATGLIEVTTPGGVAKTTRTFVVEGDEPVITSFTPDYGGPGTRVTVVGERFTGATSVQFGGIGATPSVINDTRLTVTVPALARTGVLRVISPGGVGESAAQFLVGDDSDLSIELNPPGGTPWAGVETSASLTVRNAGALPSLQTLCVVAVSGAGRLLGATAGAGDVEINGDSVTWEIGTLAVGGVRVLQLRMVGAAAGDLVIQGQVNGRILDPNESNNAVSRSVRVATPVLRVARASGGKVELRWPASTGSIYRLESRSGLGLGSAWGAEVAAPELDGVDWVTRLEPTALGVGGRWYRLRAGAGTP